MKKIHLFIGLVFSIFLISCATQKKRGGSQGLISKLYHNTTAHYNGYFNANVLYNESIANLNAQHQDNYTKILDLYKYAAADNPQTEAEKLDEAIKKVSVVVALHRQSKWTDDCYLLFGKSHYAKQDYEGAEETFRYLIDEYSPEAMEERKNKGKKKKKKVSKKKKKKPSKKKKGSKKKKKVSKKKKKKGGYVRKGEKGSKSYEEKMKKEKAVVGVDKKEVKKTTKKVKEESKEKPKSYFLKHRPAYQEARLWLAKTYIERLNFEAADFIIRDLDKDSKTEKKIRRQLAPVKAYYFLKQKEYTAAVEPLKEAIDLSRSKKDKARYAYILGQIQQDQGNQTEAYAYFKKVLKYKPSYDMEFRSRLNLTLSSWLSGTSTADVAKKSLKKMLKDGKNKEYKDQIYYTIAEISLKNNDKEEAVENLLLSLKYNSNNQTQKGESYLKLADLYYDAEDYVDAKNYYDSTLTILANTDERHFRVNNLATNLVEIASNLQVVEFQDSLLAISKLSDEDKMDLAIKIKKERAKSAAEGKTNKGKPVASAPPPINRGAAGRKSDFFAYDDRSLKKGKRDFERKWGDVKRVDNWRRSSANGSLEIEENNGGDFTLNSLDDGEVAKILADVPSTPEDFAAANDEISSALYNLGRLFYEKIQNYPRSITSLDDLFSRYPENQYELNSWYYLYLSHDALKNNAKATAYSNKICKKYPESNYCNLISNPDFLQASKKEANKLNNYYEATFTAFDNGQYKKAYERVINSNKDFGNTHELMPKFDLLKAKCLGHLEGKDAYVNALKEVIGNYPDSKEEKRAKEILRLLSGGNDVAEDSGNANSKFKLQDDKVHYCIAVLNDKIKLTKAKEKVANYNRKFNSLDKLRISNIFLGADTSIPILVIRRFKNKTEAMVYYNNIMKNKKEFLGDNANYEVFGVTQHNYREILKSRTLDGYREFFESNYL